MSVYVDNMQSDFRKMIMCHMIADSTEELLDMAKSIGVQTKWIQLAGTAKEHFDICQSKRRLAVSKGAIEITQRQLHEKIQNRKTVKTSVGPWSFEGMEA